MFSHIVIDSIRLLYNCLHINIYRPHHIIILPLSLPFPSLLIIRILHSTQHSTAPAPVAGGRLVGFPFWLRPSQPGCLLSDARRATLSSLAAVRFRYRRGQVT